MFKTFFISRQGLNVSHVNYILLHVQNLFRIYILQRRSNAAYSMAWPTGGVASSTLIANIITNYTIVFESAGSQKKCYDCSKAFFFLLLQSGDCSRIANPCFNDSASIRYKILPSMALAPEANLPFGEAVLNRCPFSRCLWRFATR